MKNFFALVFAMFIFVGCGVDADSAKDEEIENLKKEIEELKKSKSNELDTEVISEAVTEIFNEEVTEAPKQDIQSKVTVNVTDKINEPQDIYAGRYTPFVEIRTSITNNTNCGIKGVQGTLYIDDLFDKNILAINWDFTGEMIYSGKTVSRNGYGLEINQFMNEHMKLYDTKYADLKFRYIVKQIVYSDGTVEKA